jgi:hypothetical protein
LRDSRFGHVDAQSSSSSPTVPEAPIVTLTEFNQLRIGMSYDQAKAIIGAEGALMTHAGKTAGNQWDNADGSNAMLVFHDDQIMVKSQVKLR